MIGLSTDTGAYPKWAIRLQLYRLPKRFRTWAEKTTIGCCAHCQGSWPVLTHIRWLDRLIAMRPRFLVRTPSQHLGENHPAFFRLCPEHSARYTEQMDHQWGEYYRGCL